MTRIERVDRMLNGKETDRPPVSLWYHFGVQHGGGERFARLSLDFFRHYGLDVLKVMNDYYYPLPEGVEAVGTRDDLRRIARFEVADSPWKEQLRALEILRRDLGGEAYFLDTVFDPWNTFRRSLAGEHAGRLMESEPAAVHGALDVITENLIAYSRKSIDVGSAGIFLAMQAGSAMFPRETFLEFVKPYAARVLEAVSGRGVMNVAHIHGEQVYFDDCLDLPADGLNWWDRGPAGPSLPDVKERIRGFVMGGIDHTAFSGKSCPYLREHVREARAMGGTERFFLAGGCSLDASVRPGAIRAVVEAAAEA